MHRFITDSSLIRACIAAVILTLALPVASLAQPAPSATTSTFNLPAGDANETLKLFSQQSGRGVIVGSDAVRGIRTNRVQGTMTAEEAIGSMLAQTGLVATRDTRTGAFGIRAETPAEKNDPSRPATAGTAAERDGGPIKMDEYRVLGSRIRQTDVEGPSPVDVYDRRQIASTGALTLSDFLNTLPQTYGGISAGRGSVPNELNIEYGRRTETVNPQQPFVGGSPVLFTPAQTGVSGVSLRGLGGASTLVLIDGRRVVSSGVGNLATDSRQSFVDLNSIPLGLIERIEVTTDGASAIYGADAVAGVINVILRKNYVGTEVSGSIKMTEHGGARERQGTVTTGFSRGQFRGSISLNVYDRSVMYASQRAFAANMDRRNQIRNYTAAGAPIFGTDHRMQFGYAPSVQGVGLVPLNGLTTPSPVALAPIGATTMPTPSQFELRTTVPVGQPTLSAQGQRPTNIADQLELVPASTRWGVSSTFNYTFDSGMEAYASVSYSDSRTEANSLPAYSLANVQSQVDAAFSPFNQPVQIGMIHREFGRNWQRVQTVTPRVSGGVRGVLPRDWQWDLNGTWQRRELDQLSRSFNVAALNSILNDPNPAQRLNPFIDAAAAGLDRRAIYERTAIYPAVDSTSELHAVDLVADGGLFHLPGGQIKTAAGVSYERQMNDNLRTNYSLAAVPTRTVITEQGARSSYAAFSELSVPVFGKDNAQALLRRLELRVAARYQYQGSAGDALVPKYGITWSPVQSLLFRASYSEGFRVPSLTESQVAVPSFSTLTLNDPRRGNVPTPVTIVGGISPELGAETSTTEFYGVVYEPGFAKGLSLKANYYRTIQNNAIQLLSRTVILNNEALFPDRIVRAAPTAADIAAGFPGAVLELHPALVNFGRVETESADFSTDYRVPGDRFGTWRLNAHAARSLGSRRHLTPGVELDDSGDTFSPPKWKINGAVYWNRGPWNASTSVSYLSGFNSNRAGTSFRATADPAPSVHRVDVRFGYDFNRPLWRDFGKGLKVNFGIANVLDAEPPFTDVIYGYNPALHSEYVFGRTYEVSVGYAF
jgi:iron complex outermembrane recepter protein